MDNGQNVRSGRHVARVAIVLLFLAWLVDYIDRLVITLALPSIGKDFAIDKAQQGLVLTVFFITYALFQLPGGMLADKIGARKTMTVAMGAWSVFTGLTGLAFSYVSLLVVRALFGVTEGGFPGASMKAMTERTTPRQRMTGNGIMLGSNALGSALSPLIAAPALAAVGWKNSFFIVAALGIVMAAVMWRFLPRPLPGALAGPAPGEADQGPAPDASLRVRDLLKRPVLWLFALMFCGFDIVGWGLISWTPSYLIEVRHVNLETAGYLTSIPFFAATVTTAIGGLVFDRFFHHRPRRLIVPAMAATGIFLWLMIRAGSAGQFVTFESLGMAAMYLTFMPIFGLPLRLLPGRVVGAASGAINFGGQAAGAVTPFIMGALADSFSFTAAFTFLLFGVVLAIVSAMVTPQTREGFMTAMRLGVPAAGAAAPSAR